MVKMMMAVKNIGRADVLPFAFGNHRRRLRRIEHRRHAGRFIGQKIGIIVHFAGTAQNRGNFQHGYSFFFQNMLTLPSSASSRLTRS